MLIRSATSTRGGGAAPPYVPPNMYNWDPATQFPNSKTAWAAGRLLAVELGDSITAGVGSQGIDVTPYVSGSSPTLTAAYLATTSLVPASSISHAMNHNDPNADAGWVLGGGAHWSGAVALGGPLLEDNGASSDVFTYNHVAQVYDRVRIVVVSVNNAMCDISVDGGSPTGLPATWTNSGTESHTWSVARGSHTSFSIIGGSGGTTYVQTVEVWDSLTQHVDVMNCGVGGRDTSALDGAGTGWNPLAGLMVLAPPLCFIAFGANDGDVAGGGANPRSKANYKGSTENCIQKMQALNCDIVLITAPPNNIGLYNANSKGPYEDALKELSVTYNVPTWDQCAYAGTWADLNALGQTAGNFHYTQAYYARQAAIYAQLINSIKA